MQELKSSTTKNVPEKAENFKKEKDSLYLKKRSVENSSDEGENWYKQAMQKASTKRLDVSSSQLITNKLKGKENS